MVNILCYGFLKHQHDLSTLLLSTHCCPFWSLTMQLDTHHSITAWVLVVDALFNYHKQTMNSNVNLYTSSSDLQ